MNRPQRAAAPPTASRSRGRTQAELPASAPCARPAARSRPPSGRRRVLHERVGDLQPPGMCEAGDLDPERSGGQIDEQPADRRQHQPADQRRRRRPRRPVGSSAQRARPRARARASSTAGGAGSPGAEETGGSTSDSAQLTWPRSRLRHPVPGRELRDEEHHQQAPSPRARAPARGGARPATPPARCSAGTARRGTAAATSAAARRPGRRAAARAPRSRRRHRPRGSIRQTPTTAGTAAHQEREQHQVVAGGEAGLPPAAGK